MSVPVKAILDKLPVAKLAESFQVFVEPLISLLPDERLKKVVFLVIQCMLSSQTPVIAAMARTVSRLEASTWAAAKRIYRFVQNDRFDHQTSFTGPYHIARPTMKKESPDYLIVAIIPVNFEKPYMRKLEEVSIVHKSRPLDLTGKAQLTHF